MVTRFYLPSTGAADVNPAYTGTWTSSANADRRKPVTTKISSAMTNRTVNALSSGTKETILVRQYVSDPIAAQTISGTIKGQIRAMEESGTMNASLSILIKVVSNDGNTVRGTLLALTDQNTTASNEFEISLTNHTFKNGDTTPITLSSVVASAQDRIVIEIGVNEATTVTTRVLTLNFGDDSASDLAEDQTTTAANNPWIEFSGTISFGTLYTKDLTESITETDTIPKSVGRAFSDSTSLTDNIPKQPQKLLTDSITNGDVFSRIATLQRILTETIADSDTFSKQTLRSLVENIIETDTFSRISTMNRTLSETITETDILSKQIQKILTQSITVDDVLFATKITLKILTETITETDTLWKLTGRNFDETITDSDVMRRGLGRQLVENLSAIDETRGLRFNGMNSSVLLTSDVSVVSNYWSMSWWMQRPVTRYECIFAMVQNGTNGQVEVAGNIIRVESYTNNFWQQNFSSGITISDNLWHHYVLVFNAAGSYLVVDGALRDTKTANGDASNFVVRYFGRQQSQSPYVYGNWLTGSLDDVRIYNRPLTGPEITNLYNGIRVADGLIGEWLFDEGTGTTAYDTSGTGNNGAISGAVYRLGGIFKQTNRIITDSISPTDTMNRSVMKSLLEVLSEIDSVSKQNMRILSDQTTLNDVYSRQLSKVLSLLEELGVSESIQKMTLKELSDVLNESDSAMVTKSILLLLLDTIASTDFSYPGKLMTGGPGPTVSVRKFISPDVIAEIESVKAAIRKNESVKESVRNSDKPVNR